MSQLRAGRYHIEIDRQACVQCAGCVSICPTRALDMHGLDLRCQDSLCIGCDLCVRFCPVVALALEDLMAPAQATPPTAAQAETL